MASRRSSRKPTKRGSLETRKVYRALADAKGERAGLVRIIDEAKKALEHAGV